MGFLYRTLRPLIFSLPPETAHRLALCALKYNLLPAARAATYPELAVNTLGLTFPSPIGLAAGFDKNAEAIAGALGQGFGFVEAGTVTPLAQPGNPKPRLFRLQPDEAVINRLGFNNGGLSAFVENLKRPRPGIVGANIGKNKDSGDAVADYLAGMDAVYPYADYITINISSPNTPGLRALQKREALSALLTALAAKRETFAAAHGRRLPLLIKVAPDLEDSEKEDIAALAFAHAVDGLIVSNTTLSRPGLKSANATEAGGLSGKPLFSLSTRALRDFYRLTGGKLTLIGVGGIASPEDAYEKIRAGATLVQLYTALVYQGFGLVREIEEGLARLLKRDGFTRIAQAVGLAAQ